MVAFEAPNGPKVSDVARKWSQAQTVISKHLRGYLMRKMEAPRAVGRFKKYAEDEPFEENSKRNMTRQWLYKGTCEALLQRKDMNDAARMSFNAVLLSLKERHWKRMSSTT